MALTAISPMLGRSHSDETKARISESLKGENNPMYGISKKGS